MKTYLLFYFLLNVLPFYKHHNTGIDSKANADGSFTATVSGKPYAGKNNHATLSINYASMGVNVFTIESFISNDAGAARADAHFIFLIHFTGNAPQKGTYQLQDANLKKPFNTNTGKYDRGWKAGENGSPTESTYIYYQQVTG